MVTITLTDTSDNDLFQYQTLGNTSDIVSNKFDENKYDYTIYSYNTTFKISVDESDRTIKIEDTNTTLTSPSIAGDTYTYTYTNTLHTKFNFLIEKSNQPTYKITVRMVPKIVIKEKYDDNQIIIDFNPSGFVLDGNYQLIQNSSWYIKLYSSYSRIFARVGAQAFT